MSYICAQTALVLQSGVSPRDGLEMAAEAMRGSKRERLESCVRELDEGMGLSESLEKAGFPAFMTALMGVGEQTGSLQDVAEGLAKHYERLERARSALGSAVLFPTMIFALMLVVQGVLCARVLPVMESALRLSGGELRGPALVFAEIGAFINSHALLAMAVPGALLLAALYFMARPESLVAVFVSKTAYGFLASKGACLSSVSLSLKAGADAETALSSAVGISDRTDPMVKACLGRMESGQGFAEAARGSGLLDAMDSRLLDAGIKSGSLDSVMEKIALKAEDRASVKLEKTVAALEPALVAVMSLSTGFILLSVMSPLSSLIAAV